MSEAVEQQTYSDFWLNKESLYEYVPDGDIGNDFSIDLIQLAAYRRIVSNFVNILTGMDIPVQFSSAENQQLSFTDGDTVYLSATIRNKKDFDWTIGIALHEASHILLTDFDVFRSTFSKIPIPVPLTLKKKSKDKHVTEEQLAYVCKWAWNYVEDRYIDSYVFNEAPGYRGYYKAMYERFWNSDVNSKALQSDAFRIPNLLSYEFRIINMTNEETDLDALPGLRQIAELIDIEHIFRLDTTAKRMDLSYKVVEIMMDNLAPQEKDDQALSNSTLQAVHDKLKEKAGGMPNPNFNQPIKSKKKEEGKAEGEEKDEEGEGGGNGQEPCAPDDAGDISEFSDQELKELNKHFTQQRNILDHKYEQIKTGVTREQQSILEAIENANIVVVPTGYGLSGDYTQASVDSIVVKKLSRQLIDAGRSVFPLAAKDRSVPGSSKPLKQYEDAVAKGFVLGKALGKKLQIRGEENRIKYIRKTSGKIERRLLADIGCGMEGIFNKVRIEKYNKLRLHISVDASGSMEYDTKWCPTMTCVVAICVAASMVENLAVSVSFRSTVNNKRKGGELPYVVLAYDSLVDKISKVRNLFPYLRANGATPEGLAFESIAEEFIIGKHTNEQEHYFLNISDGEPAYVLTQNSNRYGINVEYSGETGALHTKRQVDKIRAQGVKVLSYFISSNDYPSFGINFNQVGMAKNRQLTLKDLFDKMYGRDAQFIDVQNVTEIARTINKLFLSKE